MALLPHFEGWDDTRFLEAEPLKSVFAGWELQNVTRSESDLRMKSLVDTLLSDGIEAELQSWLDLAFGRWEGYQRGNVDFDTVSLFVQFQWHLLKGDKTSLDSLLKKEYRKRNSLSCGPHPINTGHSAPERSKKSPQKRKARAEGRENVKRHKPEAIERSGSLVEQAASSDAPLGVALTVKKRERVKKKKKKTSKNSIAASEEAKQAVEYTNSTTTHIPQGNHIDLEAGAISDRTSIKPEGPHDILKNTNNLPVSLTSDEPSTYLSLSNWLQDSVEDEVATAADQISETETCQKVVPFVYSGPTVKPPLPELPRIWAQSRQEVCESFDWFRSYQGGVYYVRNSARGYLLSAFSARRDVFTHGGKLIISHGGGKAQSVHTSHGQTVTRDAEDQLAQDRSVRALLSNYRTRRPLVLIIDDKYSLFPYDLGTKDITYAVLGFFTIVHAWAEYQPAENERGRVVRYKFVFQWCESQGEPWWLSFDALDKPQTVKEQANPYMQSEEPGWIDESATPFRHIEEISDICRVCHQTSPQVYLQTWTCLNPECWCFWQDVNGKLLEDNLEYNPRFLQLAPANSLAIPSERLEPDLPLSTSRGPTTDYMYTRGWHCKQCGRLSCRLKWEQWECLHCKAVLVVKGSIRRASEFLYLTPPVPFQQYSIAEDSGITLLEVKTFQLEPFEDSFAKCFTYRLPGPRGFIHHIRTGNPRWNPEADEIFRDYQLQASTGALPFRRWPLRAHKCRGTLLTNYFSQNTGVPYQYVGGAENTLSFDQVPDTVMKARDLIQTRIKQALDRDASFNEVLSAAYMERQKMAFHTDDEIGLGPLVAGLSLGSPALMHFRLLARQLPLGVKRSIAISFVLRHGDVLVMDGAGVQQFYEHTVVPSNFRIAATARFIDATHLKPEQFS